MILLILSIAITKHPGGFGHIPDWQTSASLNPLTVIHSCRFRQRTTKDQTSTDCALICRKDKGYQGKANAHFATTLWTSSRHFCCFPSMHYLPSLNFSPFATFLSKLIQISLFFWILYRSIYLLRKKVMQVTFNSISPVDSNQVWQDQDAKS